MRIAVHVLVAYGLMLVLGAIWRFTPLGAALPDVVALAAVYLGLTARRQLAPSVAGAVAIGYLADLLVGSPRGMLALTAGVLCGIGHLIQGRFLVRGWPFTMVFSLMTATVAGLFLIGLRASAGLVRGGLGGELYEVALVAAVTALAGPLLFHLFRIVDARFARRRGLDVSLEGLLR